MNQASEERMQWTTCQLLVPWHEADPAGVAFHAHFVFWAERVFCQLLHDRGFTGTKLPHNIGFPVTYLECRYFKPVAFGETVTVAAAISELNDKGFSTLFRISRGDGQLAAEGRVQRRFVSLTSFRPVECPEELRRLLGSR